MPEYLNIPIIVCLFIAIDIITGVVQAFANKDLCSEKLRQGLFHKMAFVFFLALAYIIEFSMDYIDLGFTVPVVSAVAVYVCGTELVSTFENICKLNPEIGGSKIADVFRLSDKE